MRNKVFLTLSVLLFVLILCVTMIKHGDSGRDPSTFLPADVLAVVEIKNFKKKVVSFRDSHFGKALRGIDFIQVASEIGLPDNEIDSIKTIEERVVTFLESNVFDILLGREFVCGILPFKGNSIDEVVSHFEENLLVVSRPKYTAEILESLGAAFADKNRSSSQYGKYLIHKIDLGERHFLSLSVVDGLVLMAFDERNIRSSLDRYDSNDLTVLDNKDYLKLKSEFKSVELFSYFDFKKYRLLAKDLESVSLEGDQLSFTHALSTWKGVQVAAMGAWEEEGKIEEKSVVVFNETDLEPYLQEMFAFLPEPCELSFASEEALTYYWNNSFHLPSVVNMITEELERDETEIRILKEALKEITGVDYEHLLAAFGNNVGGVINQNNVDEFIPLPSFSIFLEVTDRQLVETVLEKLLFYWGIPFESIFYEDVELLFWGTQPQSGMQPVIAFYGDYFILASNISMIKNVIRTELQHTTLERDRDFKLVSTLLLEPNNKILYFKVDELVEIVKELVSWGGTMIAIKDRQTAQTSTILIDKVIHPLLDGLKMFSVVGVRTYINGNQLITTSTTAMSKQ
jgi:hypothetical protein